MITIQELLHNRCLDPKAKVKLVRHKDSTGQVYEMYRYKKDEFQIYQGEQVRPLFKGVDYIVSFVGESGRLSRFVGVYKVTGVKTRKNKDKNKKKYPIIYTYGLKEENGFEDLIDRVIIDWGDGTRRWDQWMDRVKSKPVVEIQPGLHFKQFKDYFDFILDFDELKEIVENEYPIWKRMLSATKGIYLIADSTNGNQYVGSAAGDDGIWGRWKTYVSTNGHGGNDELKKLVKKDPNYGNNFRYTILMLLPKTTTRDQALVKETLFKKKLGSKAFGLNNN